MLKDTEPPVFGDKRPPMISKDGFIDREPPILGEMTGP